MIRLLNTAEADGLLALLEPYDVPEDREVHMVSTTVEQQGAQACRMYTDVSLFQLSKEEATDWMGLTDKKSHPSTGEVTAYLAVDLRIATFPSYPTTERRPNADELEHVFWNWIGTLGSFEVRVNGDFEFPRPQYDSIFDFSTARQMLIPGFTDFEGVTLVQRREEGDFDLRVYEVRMREFTPLYKAETEFEIPWEEDLARTMAEAIAFATKVSGLVVAETAADLKK